jgi:hypothetical protein
VFSDSRGRPVQNRYFLVPAIFFFLSFCMCVLFGKGVWRLVVGWMGGLVGGGVRGGPWDLGV